MKFDIVIVFAVVMMILGVVFLVGLHIITNDPSSAYYQEKMEANKAQDSETEKKEDCDDTCMYLVTLFIICVFAIAMAVPANKNSVYPYS